MLGERHVLAGELGQRGHLLLVTGVVQTIDGDQQDVLPASHISIAQIAQRYCTLTASGFPCSNQTTLVLLCVQQTVLLKENAPSLDKRRRQVRPLHGDRAIEVCIRPDIHDVRTDKGDVKDRGHRFCVMASAGQAAQFLPAQVANSISIRRITGTLINISCQSRAVSF